MTTLSGLVAMRLNHELAGPIGAISTGVDMLGGDDAEIRELIADSAAALVATLRLHRFVLAPPEIEDAAQTGRSLLQAWVRTREGLTLDWDVTPGSLTSDQAAVLLGLAMCAAEAVPRGGAIRVGKDEIDVAAKHIMLDADIAASLRGAPVAKPRAAIAGLVRAAADALGIDIKVSQEPTRLRIHVYHGSVLPL